MKYITAVLAIASLLLLAGCNTLQQDYNAVSAIVQAKVLNPLNDRTVAGLGVTLGFADSLVVAYGALPKCDPGQTPVLGEMNSAGKFCHDTGVLKRMYAAMVTVGSDHGSGAYAQLVVLQKTHPAGSVLIGGSLHDKFAAVQSALAVLTGLTNTYVAAQAVAQAT